MGDNGGERVGGNVYSVILCVMEALINMFQSFFH